jgi:hypothetical protein
VVRSRNHAYYGKAAMLSVITEHLFTASNIEVLGDAQKIFYGEFISPTTVKLTEVCTQSARYICLISIKFGVLRQIFMSVPNMKFDGNVSSGSRAVT